MAYLVAHAKATDSDVVTAALSSVDSPRIPPRGTAGRRSQNHGTTVYDRKGLRVYRLGCLCDASHGAASAVIQINPV